MWVDIYIAETESPELRVVKRTTNTHTHTAKSDSFTHSRFQIHWINKWKEIRKDVECLKKVLCTMLTHKRVYKFLIGQLFNGIFELCATDLCNRQLSFENEMCYENERERENWKEHNEWTLSVPNTDYKTFISNRFCSVHLTKCWIFDDFSIFLLFKMKKKRKNKSKFKLNK